MVFNQVDKKLTVFYEYNILYLLGERINKFPKSIELDPKVTKEAKNLK